MVFKNGLTEIFDLFFSVLSLLQNIVFSEKQSKEVGRPEAAATASSACSGVPPPPPQPSPSQGRS